MNWSQPKQQKENELEEVLEVGRERTAEGDRMEQNPDLAINKNGVMRVGKILLTEDCQNSGSPVLIKKFPN